LPPSSVAVLILALVLGSKISMTWLRSTGAAVFSIGMLPPERIGVLPSAPGATSMNMLPRNPFGRIWRWVPCRNGAYLWSTCIVISAPPERSLSGATATWVTLPTTTPLTTTSLPGVTPSALTKWPVTL